MYVLAKIRATHACSVNFKEQRIWSVNPTLYSTGYYYSFTTLYSTIVFPCFVRSKKNVLPCFKIQGHVRRIWFVNPTLKPILAVATTFRYRLVRLAMMLNKVFANFLREWLLDNRVKKPYTTRKMGISTGLEPPVSTGQAPGTAWSVLNALAFSTDQNTWY